MTSLDSIIERIIFTVFVNGFAQLVSLPFTAKEGPKIATVHPLNTRELLIRCLTPRQTEGFLWDSDGGVGSFCLSLGKKIDFLQIAVMGGEDGKSSQAQLQCQSFPEG